MPLGTAYDKTWQIKLLLYIDTWTIFLPITAIERVILHTMLTGTLS
jgi:hypothetical protein